MQVINSAIVWLARVLGPRPGDPGSSPGGGKSNQSGHGRAAAMQRKGKAGTCTNAPPRASVPAGSSASGLVGWGWGGVPQHAGVVQRLVGCSAEARVILKGSNTACSLFRVAGNVLFT